LERKAWVKRNLKKNENMEGLQGDALDVGLMAPLFDVTIYIYVGDVLER